MPLALNRFCVSLKIPVILLITVNQLKARMTLPSKHLKVVNSRHNSLLKKKQLHSYNPRKRMELRNGGRPKSSSEVHRFNSLTSFISLCEIRDPEVRHDPTDHSDCTQWHPLWKKLNQPTIVWGVNILQNHETGTLSFLHKNVSENCVRSFVGSCDYRRSSNLVPRVYSASRWRLRKRSRPWELGCTQSCPWNDASAVIISKQNKGGGSQAFRELLFKSRGISSCLAAMSETLLAAN